MSPSEMLLMSSETDIQTLASLARVARMQVAFAEAGDEGFDGGKSKLPISGLSRKNDKDFSVRLPHGTPKHSPWRLLGRIKL